ncbi:MAG: YaaA family protein, partial [Alloprevotella sp.]
SLMQILISCSKTMQFGQTCPKEAECVQTAPRFLAEAQEAAHHLMQFSPERMAEMLKVKMPIAAAVCLNYQHFFDAENPKRAALFAYDGVVFKQIVPETLPAESLDFASKHLFITSFLYGLLRPSDMISPYRLEGSVALPANAKANAKANATATALQSRFDFWKPRLTDFLIESVNADDGVLMNLASAEMQRLFDWKRVCRETTVVTPDFKVVEGEREKNVTIYAKMSRGLAVRHLLLHRLSGADALNDFQPDIPGVAMVMRLQRSR